jgi:hypothetical protein
VKKGVWKKERKPRYTVTFHRPKTLKHARAPKYPKQRRAPGLTWQEAASLWIAASDAGRLRAGGRGGGRAARSGRWLLARWRGTGGGCPGAAQLTICDRICDRIRMSM